MKSPEPIRKRSRQSRNNFLITALSRNLLTKGSSPSFGDEIRSGVQPRRNSLPRAEIVSQCTNGSYLSSRGEARDLAFELQTKKDFSPWVRNDNLRRSLT